jgi:hypothetical protein
MTGRTYSRKLIRFARLQPEAQQGRKVGVVSNPPLPAHRIAAAVKTCDHGHAVIGVKDKHQSMRKSPQQGTADVLMD